ncbi:glycine--tRNA ligase beta subunit [mine drainage metagenome]|uniref:glycine--tRNA ligase n=1 Tax=mine drainage metagenome TaxID=410659 RepID=A0A1J5S2G3_9ZZZZ
MAEFLLELLSEEIPARMQARAAEDLARLVGEGLKKAGLSVERCRTFATPRRLTLVIDGLPEATPDVAEERRGPRVGAPAQALEGFLKGAGLTLEQCEQRDTGKGVFYFAQLRKPGQPTAALLRTVVEQVLADFPWPKSMRWGAHAVRWVRPLQSILALFGGQVVPVSFGPVTAGDSTVGHRFLSPARFSVRDFADYAARLAAAEVMLDPAARSQAILAQAEAAARAEGFALRPDEGLLAEVAGLVECPVVLAGSIDATFMDVPDEVLITSMRSHQKYFSLLKADGRLANRFLVVSNMKTADGGKAIVAGNERVLRARLSDAKFFWDTDRKHRLESRLPKLAERLYYARLGTMQDKVERVAALARHLTFYIDGAAVEPTVRAARLAKADLSSEMVGEFPELQGVMGRYYALNDGEAPEVAEAIAEHYAPQGPNDRCPTAPVSVAVALADKLDSLVGFFAIDEKPTGSKDPFALRRAALGVIRLILENGLRLPLLAFFKLAHGGYTVPLAQDADKTAADLMAFFADRLTVALREQGVRHDLIAALLAQGGEDDLVRLSAKVAALKDFVASEDGANLLIAYRRAANIVRIEEKKDGKAQDGALEAALLAEPEEQALAQALASVKPAVEAALAAEQYGTAMAELARLRRPVDAFFDKVTVNCEAADTRANRLRLLGLIGGIMEEIADFAQVEG